MPRPKIGAFLFRRNRSLVWHVRLDISADVRAAFAGKRVRMESRWTSDLDQARTDHFGETHHAIDASRSAHRLPVQKLKLRGRLLIVPMLLSSMLFLTAVKDTVWWNTPGGEVMEHRDQAAASCSLMLYDDSGSVIFAWDDPGRTFVTAIDRNWQFPDDGKMPA